MHNDLLSSRQVAERFGVRPSTVKRWVDRGVIDPARTLRGASRVVAYLFDEAEVRRLEEGTTT